MKKTRTEGKAVDGLYTFWIRVEKVHNIDISTPEIPQYANLEHDSCKRNFEQEPKGEFYTTLIAGSIPQRT